jgi:hypothetical protein
LPLARNAVEDLACFINDTKRDHESLKKISQVRLGGPFVSGRAQAIPSSQGQGIMHGITRSL